MPLTFDRPPLNEVLVGYSFLPRPDLLIPHIGRFWAEVADAYPNCQHAPVVIDNPEQPPFGMDLGLPRVWLLNDETGFVIQLQQDRLLLSWRDLGRGNKYVRFPAVKAEFLRVQNLFRQYVERLTQVPVQPTAFTMTYVNLIRSGEGWSGFQDHGRVFPVFLWNAPAGGWLPQPKAAGWRLDFELPGGLGGLAASLAQGKMKTDGTPILRLELTANSGSAAPRDVSLEDWCDGAHDAIIHAFEELTGPEMHRDHWALQPEAS